MGNLSHRVKRLKPEADDYPSLVPRLRMGPPYDFSACTEKKTLHSEDHPRLIMKQNEIQIYDIHMFNHIPLPSKHNRTA
jgi:hypothetical protein